MNVRKLPNRNLAARGTCLFQTLFSVFNSVSADTSVFEKKTILELASTLSARTILLQSTVCRQTPAITYHVVTCLVAPIFAMPLASRQPGRIYLCRDSVSIIPPSRCPRGLGSRDSIFACNMSLPLLQNTRFASICLHFIFIRDLRVSTCRPSSSQS